MTPAEHARQIDREEFEAEAAAIRERAYSLSNRQPLRKARVEQCIKRGFEPSRVPFNPVVRAVSPNFRRPAALHAAFGKEQSLNDWAKQFCLNIGTVRNRLRQGWTLEAALRKPPGNTGKRAHLPKPGVSADLPAQRETGAWGTAQETPNITFSEEAENA